MKILKILAISVAALILIFFALGIINPVFEYSNSISIAAPKAKVWSVYTNDKKNWIVGFKSQRLTSGNAFTKGAEYETIIVSGEEMVMHEKIEAIDPGTKIDWTLDNDVLTSRYSFEFTGDSTQAAVHTRYQVEGKNAFMKSILYLSKGYLKKNDQEMLVGLKRIAEN